MMCPKCGVEMDVNAESGAETDICPKCGGIWVDNVDEKQALEMQPVVFTVDELRRLKSAYKPLGKVEDVKYFKCPRCDNFMWRINYMHHSGVIVDKCRDHGVFFDQGELEKAVEFIKLGGIEYEKLRIAEKGIAELHTKVENVAHKVERMSYKLPWWARLMLYFGY